MVEPESIIEARQIQTRLGGQLIHDGIDLSVRRNEVLAIVGASGSGKSVLMRVLCLLLQPSSGSVRLFGQEAAQLGPPALIRMRQRLGVLFQRGALFTGLSVLENTAFPLREHARLSASTARHLAAMKLALTGFPADAVHRMPSALSGGMLKRAALARALALDPEVVFLDEPGSGLDPASVLALDDLLQRLVRDLDLTVVLITHDVDSLWRIANRVAFIGERRILGIDSVAALAGSEHAVVSEFFSRASAPNEGGMHGRPG